jgi:hypothetical protein
MFLPWFKFSFALVRSLRNGERDVVELQALVCDIDFNVDRKGQYLSGITTAQCAYATEFVAHTRAYRITVK